LGIDKQVKVWYNIYKGGKTMTRENREILQQLILEIVSQADPWYLLLHYDFCGGFNEQKQYVWFSAKGIAPYVAKKLGYAVRKDIIKHSLKPLGEGDGWFLIERVR
jgi:hypothetical protein